MQFNKKTFRVRYTRPRLTTGLSTGTEKSKKTFAPFEFRLAAVTDGPLNRIRVIVTANLPTEREYLWVLTDITFFSWEGDRGGIYAVRDIDAWIAEQRLRSRLFALFGEAIATGHTVHQIHIEAVIRMSWCLSDYKKRSETLKWVSIIEQAELSGQITTQEASERLGHLKGLVESLESKFVLFPEV